MIKEFPPYIGNHPYLTQISIIGGKERLVLGLTRPFINKVWSGVIFGINTDILDILEEETEQNIPVGDSVYIRDIEVGLHYSEMEDYCKKLLEVSIKYNIQFIMTTQSYEFISYMAQLNSDLVSYTKLGMRGDEVIGATYNHEALLFATEQNIEIR